MNKNKQTYWKVAAGFTMVEHLIYMGIFSLLLIVLLQLFTSIIDVHLESQATSSVSQDGNYIITRITNDIHRSQTIVTPARGASSTTSFHLTGSTIDYTYQLSGGKLLLINNTTGTSDQLNSGNTTISAVSFSHLGNNPSGNQNTVRISVVIKTKIIRSGGVEQIETFTTTVGSRK